jgi:hypothetical protein
LLCHCFFNKGHLADLYRRKGGRQPLFWHVLELRAVIDPQFFKRGEVLKPSSCPKISYLEIQRYEEQSDKGSNPGSGKDSTSSDLPLD